MEKKKRLIFNNSKVNFKLKLFDEESQKSRQSLNELPNQKKIEEASKKEIHLRQGGTFKPITTFYNFRLETVEDELRDETVQKKKKIQDSVQVRTKPVTNIHVSKEDTLKMIIKFLSRLSPDNDSSQNLSKFLRHEEEFKNQVVQEMIVSHRKHLAAKYTDKNIYYYLPDDFDFEYFVCNNKFILEEKQRATGNKEDEVADGNLKQNDIKLIVEKFEEYLGSPLKEKDFDPNAISEIDLEEIKRTFNSNVVHLKNLSEIQQLNQKKYENPTIQNIKLESATLNGGPGRSSGRVRYYVEKKSESELDESNNSLEGKSASNSKVNSKRSKKKKNRLKIEMARKQIQPRMKLIEKKTNLKKFHTDKVLGWLKSLNFFNMMI